MENRIKNDLRIDKRLRAVFGEIELGSVTSSPADTREGILAEQETDAAKEGKAVMDLVNNSPHYKEAVPETGLVLQPKNLYRIQTAIPSKFNIFDRKLMKSYLAFITFMVEA